MYALALCLSEKHTQPHNRLHFYDRKALCPALFNSAQVRREDMQYIYHFRIG